VLTYVKTSSSTCNSSSSGTLYDQQLTIKDKQLTPKDTVTNNKPAHALPDHNSLNIIIPRSLIKLGDSFYPVFS